MRNSNPSLPIWSQLPSPTELGSEGWARSPLASQWRWRWLLPSVLSECKSNSSTRTMVARAGQGVVGLPVQGVVGLPVQGVVGLPVQGVVGLQARCRVEL